MVLEFATLTETKMFFQIEDEDYDELLQFLIEHYSDVLVDKGITEQTTSTKEALWFAIGCHLSKIKMEIIAPTISYVVDDIEETYAVPRNPIETWCALYKAKLAELEASLNINNFGVAGIKRKGLYDTYGGP